MGEVEKQVAEFVKRMGDCYCARSRFPFSIQSLPIPDPVESEKATQNSIIRISQDLAALGASAAPYIIKNLGDPLASFEYDVYNNVGSTAEEKIRYGCCKALFEIGGDAIPALIEALGSDETRVNATKMIDKILNIRVNIHTTNDELLRFESKLMEGYCQLMKKHKDPTKFHDIKIEIVKLKMAIAKKKNEFSKDKGILLDDKPKPPKKG